MVNCTKNFFAGIIPMGWLWKKSQAIIQLSCRHSAHLLIYLLTYSLTPLSRVLIEKLTGSAASQEIPRIFGTPRFITVLTSARHLSLSWANSIQSPQPPPISWRSILILSSHPRLGLTNGLFPSGYLTRNLYTPLLSPIRTTCPAHLILLDFTTHNIFGKEWLPCTTKWNTEKFHTLPEGCIFMCLRTKSYNFLTQL